MSPPILKLYGSNYAFFQILLCLFVLKKFKLFHYSSKGIQSLPQTHIFQCLYLCKLIV